MNKIYIIIIILLILLYNIKEGFISLNRPFDYGNINNISSYVDMTRIIHNYPHAFKMGEIDKTIPKNYYKYLNKLHNMHINEHT